MSTFEVVPGFVNWNVECYSCSNVFHPGRHCNRLLSVCGFALSNKFRFFWFVQFITDIFVDRLIITFSDCLNVKRV